MRFGQNECHLDFLAKFPKPCKLSKMTFSGKTDLSGRGEAMQVERANTRPSPRAGGLRRGNAEPSGLKCSVSLTSVDSKSSSIGLAGGFHLHGRFSTKMLTVYHQRLRVPVRGSECKCEASHSDRFGKGMTQRSMGSSRTARS
jgi:hypothetical protein